MSKRIKQPRFIKQFLNNGDYNLVLNPLYDQLRDYSGKPTPYKIYTKPTQWTKLQNNSQEFYRVKKEKEKKWKELKKGNCNCCNYNFEHKDNVSKRNDFEAKAKRFKESLKELSKEQKIEKLKYVSENEKFKYSEIRYKGLRSFHNEFKYQYFKVWKKCFVCELNNVEHIHHIVMLKNGGTNDESNLVGICEKCHCEIHDWMNNLAQTLPYNK